MEYFIHRYPHILHNVDLEQLNKQFITHQTLLAEEIPVSVKESTGLDLMK